MDGFTPNLVYGLSQKHNHLWQIFCSPFRGFKGWNKKFAFSHLKKGTAVNTVQSILCYLLLLFSFTRETLTLLSEHSQIMLHQLAHTVLFFCTYFTVYFTVVNKAHPRLNFLCMCMCMFTITIRDIICSLSDLVLRRFLFLILFMLFRSVKAMPLELWWPKELDKLPFVSSPSLSRVFPHLVTLVPRCEVNCSFVSFCNVCSYRISIAYI